jgi:hypothetical protein
MGRKFLVLLAVDLTLALFSLGNSGPSGDTRIKVKELNIRISGRGLCTRAICLCDVAYPAAEGVYSSSY